MCGSRIFCQFYLVLSLFYRGGPMVFFAEKTILILNQGSRGGPLSSRGECQTLSRGGGDVKLFPGWGVFKC